MDSDESIQKINFDIWEDEELNLKNNLLRGIFSIGFENPSPIQKKSIIPLVNGKDMVAQAQSGTGKTGAFSIGLLQKIKEDQKTTQAIIMTPTRELANQIYDVISQLSHFMNVTKKTLIGGVSVEGDLNYFKETQPHIIIGCPGRIYDMICRKALKTNNIALCILDEADEMFSSGFKDQVYKIFQYFNSDIQICLFSATISSDLNILLTKFMRSPIKILEKRELLTLQGIKQYYVALDNDRHKYLTLKDLFSQINITQTIIYCNSIHRTENLYNYMNDDEFPVERIHSDMNQKNRRKIYEKFKSGETRVLISTDLFSRGIDVQQVSIVINYDLPKNVHTYLHRIGRSGRWGRKGVGINFITKRDLNSVRDIEKYYSTEIVELPMDYMTSLK